MNKRNAGIDFFKYIAAILVIAIHSRLFSDINNNLYFAVVHLIARVAVPFFAVCSGYYMAARAGGRATWENEDTAKLLKQWKKLIIVYAVWTMLYLLYSIPTWIQTGWFSAWAFVDFGIAAVLSGSHYHLWYFLAIIYAFPLFCVCLRYIKPKYWMPVSGVLYCCKVLTYGYRFMLPAGIQHVTNILNRFQGLRDGVLLILPMMLLGAIINRRGSRFSRKTNFVMLFCAAALLSAEAIQLYRIGQQVFSFIFFTYPVAYFVFVLVLDTKPPIHERTAQRLGVASSIIYGFHPMALEIIKRTGVQSVVLFLSVAIVSTFVALVYSNIKLNIKKKIGERLCSH